jgi:hypothetical protein
MVPKFMHIVMVASRSTIQVEQLQNLMTVAIPNWHQNHGTHGSCCNISDDESVSAKPQSRLVKSCTAWQNLKEMAKWIQEEQLEDQGDDEDDNMVDIMYGPALKVVATII